MTLRYRKRIKVCDGVHINISKRGLSSLSLGMPGSSINLGVNTLSATVGIPGSGLAYRQYHSKTDTKSNKSNNSGKTDNGGILGDIDMDEIHRIGAEAEETLEIIKQQIKEDLERYLHLNMETKILSHEEYWNEVEKHFLLKYENRRAIKAADIKRNAPILVKAIKNNVDGAIFIQNSSVTMSLPIRGLVNFPTGAFGDLFVGSGMGIVDKEIPIIALDIKSLDLSKEDRTSAKNHYVGELSVMILFVFFSHFLLFYVPGVFMTLLGLFGYAGFTFWTRAHWHTIFSSNPIENLAVVYRIARQEKIWEKELNDEKTAMKELMSQYRHASVDRAGFEKITDSIPFMTFDMGISTDLSLTSGIVDDNTLCILLQLPSRHSLEVKNKTTPGGKESVQEKSKKELNTEYATSVLNLAYYILARGYSAYPVFSKIQFMGYTTRVSESTGNDQKDILVCFDSKRADLDNINFASANSIKLTQHLKYQIDLDDKNYLKALDIGDFNLDELLGVSTVREDEVA